LYSYRPDGIRVLSDRGAANKSYYLLDNVSVVAEYDATGALARSNVFTDRIDEIISVRLSTLNPQPSTGETEKYWYHADALGSVYRITDRTGAVVNRYGYSAYGEVSRKDEETGSMYFWMGREQDFNSQYYFRKRYWSSEVGWLSKDTYPVLPPFAGYKSFNNAPTNFTDPLGLFFSEGVTPNTIIYSSANPKGHKYITKTWLAQKGTYYLHYLTAMQDGNVDVDRGSIWVTEGHALTSNVSNINTLKAIQLDEAFINNKLMFAHNAICRYQTDDAAKKFGGALHTFQDMEAHNYAVLEEHLAISGLFLMGLSLDIDDPYDAATQVKTEKAIGRTDYELVSFTLYTEYLNMYRQFLQ
jgi:RHS repeat-associated protein